MSISGERVYQVGVSLFVAAILLGQGAAVVQTIIRQRELGSKFWPICDYPMYDNAHYEGEPLNTYTRLEGVLKDGTVVSISSEELGLNKWHYSALVKSLGTSMPDAISQRKHRAAIERLRGIYAQGEHLVKVRIKTLPVILTRTGRGQTLAEAINEVVLTAHGTALEKDLP